MSYSPPSSAKPFTLKISDQDIADWRQLLQLSKTGPETYEGRQEDRRFGVTHKWIVETKDYWLNKYDWCAQEKRINSIPNYKMEIEGIDLHFLALFSEKKDAIPIAFHHGWPGSFIEFLPICELIQKKYSAKDLPYHIIVPSLPGYTLSSEVPADKDWTMQDTARICNQLMTNLGFDKYFAQGGDIGSFVSKIMGLSYDACVGIHLNMFAGARELPEESTASTEAEKLAIRNAHKWRETGTAYALEHATKPSTIGHVLSSSPLALMAWIGEKMLAWSDTDPSIDEILTNISLYWFTQSFPRSIYPYRAIFAGHNRQPMPFLEKPTGFSFFPYELMPGIKSVIEKDYNLISYKQHESGGHFAALEKPEELWADVEEFVGKAWKADGKAEARL